MFLKSILLSDWSSENRNPIIFVETVFSYNETETSNWKMYFSD